MIIHSRNPTISPLSRSTCTARSIKPPVRAHFIFATRRRDTLVRKKETSSKGHPFTQNSLVPSVLDVESKSCPIPLVFSLSAPVHTLYAHPFSSTCLTFSGIREGEATFIPRNVTQRTDPNSPTTHKARALRAIFEEPHAPLFANFESDKFYFRRRSSELTRTSPTPTPLGPETIFLAFRATPWHCAHPPAFLRSAGLKLGRVKGLGLGPRGLGQQGGAPIGEMASLTENVLLTFFSVFLVTSDPNSPCVAPKRHCSFCVFPTKAGSSFFRRNAFARIRHPSAGHCLSVF